MAAFEFQKTSISGLYLIRPPVFMDQRGYFSKPFEANIFTDRGIPFTIAEELESRSSQWTLRGLHFQRSHSQDKLVRVLSGEVYDVAVDLRPDSETFGKWESFCLSGENKQMLYIPKGFAHGFLVLSQDAVMHYLCGDRYDSDSESGIVWNDPCLNIRWPLKSSVSPLLSQRDKSFQSFAQFRAALSARTD